MISAFQESKISHHAYFTRILPVLGSQIPCGLISRLPSWFWARCRGRAAVGGFKLKTRALFVTSRAIKGEDLPPVIFIGLGHNILDPGTAKPTFRDILNNTCLRPRKITGGRS